MGSTKFAHIGKFKNRKSKKILTRKLARHPRYFSLYTLDQHEELDWGVAGCYMFDLMVDIVPQMFHTASNWLTLGECCADCLLEVDYINLE